MQDILNHIQINETIATSGQVNLQNLTDIEKENYKVVINLALNNSSNALKNEDELITDLGMTYIHIPVDFELPLQNDLRTFLNILNSFQGEKVWIHCEQNYKVTAFMYVYHKYFLKTPFDDIDLSIFDEWTPSTVWQNLMKISFDELKNP